MSKKILSIALALVLVLFSAVAFADTFEGIGEGFKPLQVKVDVADGKITAIDMIVNDETPEIGGVAIEKLTKQIIEGQTLAVVMMGKVNYLTKHHFTFPPRIRYSHLFAIIRMTDRLLVVRYERMQMVRIFLMYIHLRIFMLSREMRFCRQA